MKCSSCNCENLPIRETYSTVGSRISHPRNCGQCGAALTEECPVCLYHHIIGTKFCQTDGTDIALYKQEHAAWTEFRKTLIAMGVYRPHGGVALLGLVSALATVGSLWHMITTPPSPAGEGYFLTGMVLMVVATVCAISLGGITHSRVLRHFNTRGYKVLKPTDRVLQFGRLV